jgi:glycogen debranching enzyme
VDAAFVLALDDLARNIAPYKDGLLQREEPVFLAGSWYDAPWTRDAAINTWNGAGLLYAAEAKNTLLSVLERRDGVLLIGGEYWDAIVWTLGAWSLFLTTGDVGFLSVALEATRNSLRHLEETELTLELGLFRGPALYGDGVSAYPDVYAVPGDDNIGRWPEARPDLAARPGEGLPMHALSTNCVYVRAYELATAMATQLGLAAEPRWREQAVRLRTAIEERFWVPELGHYRYLVDPLGHCDVQEGFGHGLAILFGIADDDRRASIFRAQHVTAAGIPCLWPPFDRYVRGGHVGRHSGTVWPPVQGFWAEVAARHGQPARFAFELETLAAHAVRDGQFFELYHPETRLPYGGLQERLGEGIVLWEPVPHQTWSATAFLRMILKGVAGMRFAPEGVRFEPLLPPGLEAVELEVPYRDMTIDLRLRGRGATLERALVNGHETEPFLAAGLTGRQQVAMVLRE